MPATISDKIEIIERFVSYVIDEVRNGSIYVRGGQGERGSNINDNYIAKREYNDKSQIARVKKTLNKRMNNPIYKRERIGAFDCSGLVVYFFLSYGLLNSDTTADGLKGKSKQIKRDEVRAGDFCCILDSNKKCTHIAVAIDNINCVEARGRDYGVQLNEINDRNFNYFCRFDKFI